MSSVRSTVGPVNRVAARVMRPGIHFDKAIPEHTEHWQNPPPSYSFIPQRGNPQSVDLTGRQFGLFTVVGWMGGVGSSAGVKKNRRGMWLVRCACGDYEMRSARAIRNPANSGDRCYVCADVKRKRERPTEAQLKAEMKARK